MKLPALQGVIKRRILVNFRAEPDIIQAVLPPPFRPKLHNGNAIAGVCLIRLEGIRPLGIPSPIGLSSESAAHRIAVLWNDANGETKEGVFIPRRDTGSFVNHLVGGRLFPGEHHLASFHISETETSVDFCMESRDKQVKVEVAGSVAPELPETSCFANLAQASAFFEAGCLGYSVRRDSSVLDGIVLQTRTWDVQAFAVSRLFSSYFSDTIQFPEGSLVFDHALLMRNIAHEWHASPEMAGKYLSALLVTVPAQPTIACVPMCKGWCNFVQNHRFVLKFPCYPLLKICIARKNICHPNSPTKRLLCVLMPPFTNPPKSAVIKPSVR